MNNIIRGKLNRWNDDKGFGFISPEDGSPDVFIHISALNSMSRRPVIGDVIFYQYQVDGNGKSKAVNAMIEGVPRVRQKAEKYRTRISQDNTAISRFICILGCLAVCTVLVIWFVKERKFTPPDSSLAAPTTEPISSGMEPGSDKTVQKRDLQPAVSAPAQITQPKTSVSEPGTDQILQSAYDNKQSNIQVHGKGYVVKVLSDDSSGSRHQRFILGLNSGQTILVAHNIDLAQRINDLKAGDNVEFFGEYEWNPKGGVIHWTHHDPDGKHEAGWIKHYGKNTNRR